MGGAVALRRWIPVGPFIQDFRSEFHLLRHRLAMLVPQVAVRPHRQSSAVLVTEPARNRWDVHTGFDASRCEQMPQVMVGDSFDGQNFYRAVN